MTMTKTTSIHFEVSERKILLRLLDLVVMLLGIYGLELFLNYNYLTIDKENLIAILVFVVYFPKSVKNQAKD